MKNHIFILILLLPFFCERVHGATPPQSQWSGDVEAFSWQGGRLSISPETPLSQASISHDFSWKGNETTWVMQTAFTGAPTGRNGFRWTLFALKSNRKMLSYLITPEENGSVLLLQERSRSLSEEDQNDVSVRSLLRVSLSPAQMAWQELKIVVRYSDSRLNFSLSGGNVAEQKDVEIPDVSDWEIVSTMTLEAFYTKIKRSMLVWDNIEAGGDEVLDADPKIVDMSYDPEESVARLTFTESVDHSSAMAKISDESVAVSLREGAKPEELLLHFSPALLLSHTYTLSIENLRTIKSSKVFNVSFTFSLEDTEAVSSLLLSEFLTKPLPGKAEYIELFNSSHSELALSSYTLYYNNTAYELPDVKVPPRSFVVLYKEGLPAPIPEAIPLKRFPTLANTRFSLSLFLEEEVDRVVYGDNIAGKDGQSVERLDILNPHKTLAQWRPTNSPSGGTPGMPPAQQPFEEIAVSDIVINEVLAHPVSGGDEFIELYNRSDKEMDLKDLALEIRTGTELKNIKSFALSDTSYILPASGFIVLTRYKKSVSSFYPQTDPKTLYEKMHLPTLPNTIFSLHLRSQATGQVIDEMLYRRQYLGVSPKPQTGTSLERISPDAPGMEPTSWRAALLSAGKATPGLPNSVLGLPSDSDDGKEQAWPKEEVIPFEDILRLVQAYSQNASGTVFSLRGVPVLNIRKEALLLFVEQIKQGENKHHLPSGIYILHIHLDGPEGKHPVRSSLKWLSPFP